MVFKSLKNAGFSGKLGLSVDKFHGIETAKLAEYCLTARKIFRNDTIIALNYASRAPDQGLEPIQKLAKELDAVIEFSPLLGRHLLVSDDLTMTLNWNHLANVERAEALPGNPWDGTWFEEDYCEGPGQALIVNPRGEVKPCCGFASDLDQLTIGNIHTDRVKDIIRKARDHPFVGKLFKQGLSSFKEDILKRDANALPGATSNHCYFCWHVLTRGMVEGLSGNGGQVGNWCGKPKDGAQLIELNVRNRK
jgi:radical SAM protein with 4Fe4S-binding SPASM domain